MKTKSKNTQHKCKVYYQDLFGKQKSKTDWLLENSIGTTKWTKLKTSKPHYFFTPKILSNHKYESLFSLKTIFKLSNMGIASGKDEEFVKFNKSDYDYSEQDKVTDYYYRPFDVRKILYDIKKLQRARFSIMKNLAESNLVLLSVRQSKSNSVSTMITNKLSCRDSVTNHTYIFPLYILSNGEEKIFFGVKEQEIEYDAGSKTQKGLIKTENFTKEFRSFINGKYTEIYSPEQILGYIYAVLHSPTYRTKYLEFLKIDFPRIPFTDDEKIFNELSEIGFELIEHHLLRVNYSDNNICKSNGTGENFKVEKVEYKEFAPNENDEADFLLSSKGEKSGRVWFNKDRYFEPVPESVWNFYIGGYQVLDKWLKERKKHEITLLGEDIQHFIKVVNVLDFTIKTMQKIDELTLDWL